MLGKQTLLVLLAVTLFGCLGGLVATLIQPVVYQAEAYVVVYEMPRGFTDLLSPDEAAHLDAVYRAGALQDSVLQQVQARLPDMSIAAIKRDVQVEIVAYTPLTRITATGETPDQAAALANAVASGWTADAGAANAQAYAVTKAGLQAHEQDLEQQITAAQKRLAAASSSSTMVAAVQAELATLQQALGDTETAIIRLDTARFDVAGNAFIATSAQAADAVAVHDPLKNAAMGSAIGVALGWVLALWMARRRKMVRMDPPYRQEAAPPAFPAMPLPVAADRGMNHGR